MCIKWINIRSIDKGDAESGILFPFEPVIKTHEYVVHVDLLHDPQTFNLEVLSKIFNMPIDERVHKLNQNIY